MLLNFKHTLIKDTINPLRIILSKRQTNPRKTGLFRTKVRLRDFRASVAR
jgi:hypothetical protein